VSDGAVELVMALYVVGLVEKAADVIGFGE
jgi:hypothetical protein